MESIPFGVQRFDSLIGGGAPPGTVVMLAGEAGAGAREFLYTSAMMNALYHADPEQFDLHYGDLPEGATPPPEIHYLSFTAGEEYLHEEMSYTMAESLVDPAIEEIQFHDFSPEYFQLSPVPREWYVGETRTVQELGERDRREDLLSALGDYLSENASNNLVLIDSITDLVGAISDEMTWGDVALVMKGLQKAAHRWGGLILILVSDETLEPTERGQLMDAAGGTLSFEWEAGGSKRARTMVVEEFRGILSQLESENIVRFETDIGDAGLDVSDVRKIR